MSKFHKEWKKFLKETKTNDWDEYSQVRDADLEHQESHHDQPGAGFTDAKLEESDYDVLRDILRHFELSRFSGGGDRAEKFAEIMLKLGVELNPNSRGPNIEEIQESSDSFKVPRGCKLKGAPYKVRNKGWGALCQCGEHKARCSADSKQRAVNQACKKAKENNWWCRD